MKALEPWTRDWKRDQLRSLFADWRDCMRCRLAEKRHNIVFGNGSPMADMLFVGQAPGEVEDESGEPFSGPSGELFDALLAAAGIERKEVFTTNLVMCWPPENRLPAKDEREACLDRLHRQIYVVDPMLIIPVGGAAMKALMRGDNKSIDAEHGKLGTIKIPGLHTEITYDAMPIFHTAYILREDVINPKTRQWSDGGPAHKTVKDLTRAKQLVKFLKAAYERVLDAHH